MMGNYRIFKTICVLMYATLSYSQQTELISKNNNGINCNGRTTVCVGPLSFMSCESDGAGNYITVGAVNSCAPGHGCINDNKDICVPIHLPNGALPIDNTINTFGLISRKVSDPLHEVPTEESLSSTTSAVDELTTTTQSETTDNSEFTTYLSDTTIIGETTTESIMVESITDSYTEPTTESFITQTSAYFEDPTTIDVASESNYDFLVLIENEKSAQPSLGTTLNILSTKPLNGTISVDSSINGNFVVPINTKTSVDAAISVDSIINAVPDVTLNAPTLVDIIDPIDSTISVDYSVNNNLGVLSNPSTSIQNAVSVGSITNTTFNLSADPLSLGKVAFPLDSKISVDSSINRDVQEPVFSANSENIAVAVDLIGNTMPLNPPQSLNTADPVHSTIFVDSSKNGHVAIPVSSLTTGDGPVSRDSILNTGPAVNVNPPLLDNVAVPPDSKISVDSSINRDVREPVYSANSENIAVAVDLIGNTMPLNPPQSLNTADPVHSTIFVDSSKNGHVAIPVSSLTTGDGPVSRDSILNTGPAVNVNQPAAPVDTTIIIDSLVNKDFKIPVDPFTSGDGPVSIIDIGIVQPTLNNEPASLHSEYYSQNNFHAISSTSDESPENNSLNDKSIDSKEYKNKSLSNVSIHSEDTSHDLSNDDLSNESKQENISESNESNSKTHKKTVIKPLKEHECVADDVIPDPSHCNKYFRCIRKKLNKTKFEHLRCYGNQNFDADELKCKNNGKCVTAVDF